MTAITKILVIKTSSLGDVIHCLPVINDIRAHYPNVQIDWVVEEIFIDIPRMHSGINNVFTVAMRRWKKSPFSRKTWSEISVFKKAIKQTQYDAVIDCQGLLKSALITSQARTTIHGLKHGYDKNSIREPIASQFYERKYDVSYNQHAVTRNRILCSMSLGYALPTNAPNYGIEKHGIEKHFTAVKNDGSAGHMDIGFQSIDLKGFGLENDYIIALHGTSRDSKLWPVENWVSLAIELAKQNCNLVLPWANDIELMRANLIANQLKNATVLPKLSIAQIAAVIASAKAAIGVDTGLSHLACALNIPTIAIYTDTEPGLTGVMGSRAPAINLGSIGEIPNVNNILKSLHSIIFEKQLFK